MNAPTRRAFIGVLPGGPDAQARGVDQKLLNKATSLDPADDIGLEGGTIAANIVGRGFQVFPQKAGNSRAASGRVGVLNSSALAQQAQRTIGSLTNRVVRSSGN